MSTEHDFIEQHQFATGTHWSQQGIAANELDEPDPPYPSARVRAALAEAYDRSAPPMGWPYPERVTQA